MALDGIFLNNLIYNIKPYLIDTKIDKINQPEKDEIIFTLRKDRKNLKLLISSSSSFPRIHFTKIQKENPLKAPMYLMVLRKYLLGGKITNVSQVNGDRIVVINIEASDEMGFNSAYNLIIEIMGRHSNITLVRERDNKIIDSIKHITPDINSYRTLLPGLEYVWPPESKKINPYNFTLDNLKAYIASNSIEYDELFYYNVFTGISKPLSKDLYTKTNYSLENIDFLYNSFSKFILNLNNNLEFNIYTDKNGIYKDFYSIPLTTKEFNKITFDDPSELLDEFFSTKDKQERLLNKSANLQKLIHNNIDRCKKKEKILNNTLKDCEKKEDYKIKGDLLTSFIYSFKKGDKEISLNNFFVEDSPLITISLDENKTPSENVQRYYKKYNKMKKSEIMATQQLAINTDELKYLNSVLSNILNAESYTEIDDIKQELITTGYIKHKRNAKKEKKSKESKPYHFISSTGFNIYVGKNNIQNDYLSLKFANKNDLWLHAKDIPGSHVVIQGNNIDETTIEEAAIIAAYYSKNKTNTKVPIDYTLIKNLRKPNGAKPGMVIYYTNKTIYVDPQLFSTLNITQK
ncbi:NFACT family protein [Clostridium sp. MSJ-8]|uniref:Rqc2 family fibronectin-binding protein n=1 Tax=Clostridium sp. MSJ-8 TaxID=2841510 RepID=UPI001C0F0349|nr:NFACT RNA binding domain-containing protein [Clostridium sp. MSJ-8]MBU5487550.1 NFACT family protein [Clostridium sp. MSJ-8]